MQHTYMYSDCLEPIDIVKYSTSLVECSRQRKMVPSTIFCHINKNKDYSVTISYLAISPLA